jgi:predicted MFS family arabinose efflux permease
VKATTILYFGTYTTLFGVFASFYQPYGIALVSRVDASTRFSAAAQAFVLIGSAAGAKLGSEVLGYPAFQGLTTVASACVLVSIFLSALAHRLSRQNILPTSKPVSCRNDVPIKG